MNRELAKNFLNKELADLAKIRKDIVVPELATVRMADIARVKIKQMTTYAPSR